MNDIGFMLKYVWPVMRKAYKNDIPKRCARCIISEKCDDTLEYSNFCKACSVYDQEVKVKKHNLPADRYRKFMDVMLKIESDPRRILFLLSGGKDSIYCLKHLRETFHSHHIIAMVVDCGFINEIALGNARWAAKEYGVDLIHVRSHQGQFKKKLREAFLNLGSEGCYKQIDFVHGSTIFDVGKLFCRDLGIEVMASGMSPEQLELIVCDNSCVMEQDEWPGLKQVFPMAVWNPSEEQINKHIPDHIETDPLKTNHSLVLPMCVLDIKRLGYFSFEQEFGSLVRRGKADRKKWLYAFEMLEFFSRKGWLDPIANNELAKLGLSLKDLT